MCQFMPQLRRINPYAAHAQDVGTRHIFFSGGDLTDIYVINPKRKEEGISVEIESVVVAVGVSGYLPQPLRTHNKDMTNVGSDH